jgi:DNA-binding transcriptional regulator YhcF (GntR family)
VSKRHGYKYERYVKLRFWLLNSPAWQSLPPAARALYIDIVKRYNGSNNGRIVMGVRDAAKLIGVSKDTALLAFRFLEDRGFIICTKRGAFSHKTCMDASEWRLTEYDSDYPVQSGKTIAAAALGMIERRARTIQSQRLSAISVTESKPA